MGQQPGTGTGRGQFDRRNQNFRHDGNFRHNNNFRHGHEEEENESNFFFGFFFPGFGFPFAFGGWGFDSYCPGCYYSPFYSYGFPYVTSSTVVVASDPGYSYSAVPSYNYGNDYYLSQGSYTGYNAVMDDIKNAWLTNNSDLILRHVDPNAQIAIYSDGKYSYSLAGSDYENMVRDALGHIRTIDFNIYNVAQRSDGAYTVYAKHTFYDLNNNQKVAYVTYTIAQTNGGWAIVATGSSPNPSS